MDKQETSTETTCCKYFPDAIECDETCDLMGCAAQGLLIHMRAKGVPESELGDYHDANSP